MLLYLSKVLLWLAGSVAVAAAVNPNGIKTLWANYLSTFFIKGNPVFSNGSKSLPGNPPDWLILCNWVFGNFILAEELFAKALWNFETWVFVNNNLCGKLFLSSESPKTFDESFKVTSVQLVIPDFNSLSYELDKCFIDSFYIYTILKHNKITYCHNSLWKI